MCGGGGGRGRELHFSLEEDYFQTTPMGLFFLDLMKILPFHVMCKTVRTAHSFTSHLLENHHSYSEKVIVRTTYM